MEIETKPNLVIYGDALVEILVQVESLPNSGQDAVVKELTFLPGGSAANCAVAAARLGSRVKFIGVTGQDNFDALLRKDLTHSGVDIQHLRQLNGSTAMVITIIDSTGERTFLSFRGAAATQDYGSISESILQSKDTLHVSGYTFQTYHSRNLANSLIEIGHQVGAKISLDPSYHFASELGKSNYEILSRLDFLLPNKEEALLITNTHDVHQAARRLLDLGVKTVLLKLGADGCLVATGDHLAELPGYHVSPVVDTTGAGDAFAGGFFSALIQGCNLHEAVTVGQAAAAIVITQVGGHEGAPSLTQLRNFSLERHDEQLYRAVGKMDIHSS